MKLATMLFVVAVVLAKAHYAIAQDPVKLSPHLYTVLLENEHVRVLDFHIKAGQKEPMHHHPAAVVYVLAPGKARFITPDGKSEERESQAGTTVWSDAVTHAYEYLGPGEGHILMIELKDVSKAPVAKKKGK